MARKPGKPIRSKHAAKRGVKPVVDAPADVRRSPRVAVPIASDDAALNGIDSDIGPSFEPSDDNEAPIEVSEFHPVKSAQLDAAEEAGDELLDSGSDDAASPKEPGAVVPVDPLSRYLTEIRRFPLLTS